MANSKLNDHKIIHSLGNHVYCPCPLHKSCFSTVACSADRQHKMISSSDRNHRILRSCLPNYYWFRSKLLEKLRLDLILPLRLLFISSHLCKSGRDSIPHLQVIMEERMWLAAQGKHSNWNESIRFGMRLQVIVKN